MCLVQTPEALAAFVVPPSADPYCLERGVDSVSDGHSTDGRRGPTTELGPLMSVGTHKLGPNGAMVQRQRRRPGIGTAALPRDRGCAPSHVLLLLLTPVPGLPRAGRGAFTVRLPGGSPLPGPNSNPQCIDDVRELSIISVGLTLTSNVFPIDSQSPYLTVFEVHERCVM